MKSDANMLKIMGHSSAVSFSLITATFDIFVTYHIYSVSSVKGICIFTFIDGKAGNLVGTFT